MSRGLRRFQESGQSHFVTFSCYRRQPFFSTAETYDLFVQCLEDTRCRLEMCIYGYAVMPEHVHLLLSEPPRTRLADAIHYLKLSFAKRLRSQRSPEKSAGFWQKRYYDRNVRSYREFVVKSRYLHRNPVKRGLVSNLEDWKWSSYRHYAVREIGIVEIESEWTARDREQKARGGVPRIFLRFFSKRVSREHFFPYEEPLELVCTSPATRPDFMIKAVENRSTIRKVIGVCN